MKKEEVTKVVIDEKDIITLIENSLLQQGLKPKKGIKINIDKRYTGYGMGEMEFHVIGDTIIECVKTN